MAFFYERKIIAVEVGEQLTWKWMHSTFIAESAFNDDRRYCRVLRIDFHVNRITNKKIFKKLFSFFQTMEFDQIRRGEPKLHWYARDPVSNTCKAIQTARWAIFRWWRVSNIPFTLNDNVRQNYKIRPLIVVDAWAMTRQLVNDDGDANNAWHPTWTKLDALKIIVYCENLMI